jgi:hypothetical protein
LEDGAVFFICGLWGDGEAVAFFADATDVGGVDMPWL